MPDPMAAYRTVFVVLVLIGCMVALPIAIALWRASYRRRHACRRPRPLAPYYDPDESEEERRLFDEWEERAGR